jgi:carbonic anhydrase
MKGHTFETQATITPQRALEFLKEGNVRFMNNLRVNRNLLQQANETRDGHWPFATIVSCIDSRTSPELGHSGCDAIKGACDHVEMDSLTDVQA